ncbi:MAG: BMC domain-containing protein [Chloroherpetonaceae bacterium]|nr:BMC domain-containing protein [Chloroherpetonaceae bacterium]
MREELAVGLIETRGLVAAIEAADAALKTADVKLISIDRVDAGLMTVKVVGDVAAVQSAVDAGRMAAQRVGTLVAAHVIPRPDVELHDELIYVEVRPRKKQPNAPASVNPLSASSSRSATKPSSAPAQSASQRSSLRADEGSNAAKSFEAMTVQELRRYARSLPNFPIQGREISRADKETLLALLRRRNA